MFSKAVRSVGALRRCSGLRFATCQPAILNRDMGQHQWYLHLSRQEGADLATCKKNIQELRKVCDAKKINLVVGFGPSMLKDVTDDRPSDFVDYETFKSIDGSGREAKATQEELLIWMNSPQKDDVWRTQWDFKNAMEGKMKVARETFTFIYGDSLDMTGFTDGTGNPEASQDETVGCIPEGEKGAGGSFVIAQRWVHDLKGFEKLPLAEQEGVFGRTKEGSVRMNPPPAHSHLAHVELRESDKANERCLDVSKPKREEITRRSTPYAFHDGSVGLYFIGFCKTQKPLIERMQNMYGMNGEVRDRLTDFSNPASGSFYFAPSVETLNAL